MSSFASYAFNKSHSAAYAVIAYRTAYLKCHFPAQFTAALLTSVIDDSTKIALYIDDLARLKINVLSPSVNESFRAFTSDGKSVRFGLLAIKISATILLILLSKKEALTENTNHFMIL